MWSVWDKKSEINGFSPEWFFDNHEFLRDEGTIYLRTVDGRVTNVEGKSILASMYGIDPALADEEFIAAYEAMMAEPEDTDTTTYAELAQVYREGVNSIE
jgi:hypothetical protein